MNTLQITSTVQTTVGFLNIWDLSSREEVILADGTTCSISNIEESEQESYRVILKDDRSVELGSDQLIRVYQHSWRPDFTKWRVHQVSKVKKTYPNRISKFGVKEQRDQRYLQLVLPYCGEDRDLPLHPYLLGALLGDGSLGGKVSFTSADPELVDELNIVMPPNTKMSARSTKYAYGISWAVRVGNPGPNLVDRAIRGLGLCGTVSNNKFIPDIYMEASLAQRIALLQGLMDTDGTIDAQKTCSFCSVSRVLADQVQYLVRSIGGIAAIATKTPTFTYLGIKKDGQLAYQVNIRIADSSLLFRLPRKLVRVGDGNQYSDRLRLEIKSIEPIGLRKVRTLVLPVENPIYVLGDFIALHGISHESLSSQDS